MGWLGTADPVGGAQKEEQMRKNRILLLNLALAAVLAFSMLACSSGEEGDAMGEAKEAVEQMTDDAAEAAGDAMDAAGETAGDAMDAAEEAAGDAKEAVEEGLDKAGEGLEEAKEAVEEAADDVKKKVGDH